MSLAGKAPLDGAPKAVAGRESDLAPRRFPSDSPDCDNLLLGQFSDGGDRLSQTDELSRVKARIKALTDKTAANGCTEAEAMSAAEMVGRLLERYALNMDEIEVRSARCVQVKVHLGSRRRRPIDGCVPAIARFCDCKVWLAPAGRPDPDDRYKPIAGIRYIFFGFETDTSLAAYLFAVIDRAISTEISTFKCYNPRLRAEKLRRASASFQHGLVARVAARLERMHDEREAAVRAQGNRHRPHAGEADCRRRCLRRNENTAGHHSSGCSACRDLGLPCRVNGGRTGKSKPAHDG